MGETITIGVDLAKSVFQVHAEDAAGNVVVRRTLRRSYVVGLTREGRGSPAPAGLAYLPPAGSGIDLLHRKYGAGHDGDVLA